MNLKYTTGLGDKEPLTNVVLKDLGMTLLIKMPYLWSISSQTVYTGDQVKHFVFQMGI